MRLSPFLLLFALAFLFALSSPVAAEKILTITSEPPGATVELNGNRIGVTPIQEKIKEFWFNGPKYLWSEFLNEPLQMTVSKEGYVTQTITITAGPYRWVNMNSTAEKIFHVIKQTSFHVKLQSVAEASGMNLLPVNVTAVTVNSEPGGAEIYVDGKFEGSTPSKLLLSPGEHTIRVTRPDNIPWERRVTVELGAEKTLNAVLEGGAQPPDAASNPHAASPPQTSVQSPELVTVTGHVGWVNTLAFSPDGKTLASGGTDGAVNLWDVESGRGVRTFAGDAAEALGAGDFGGVTALTFTPNGKTLASAAAKQLGKQGDSIVWQTNISLWDVASGRRVGGFSINGIKALSMAFSPNGRWLAFGGTGNVVALLDAANGQLLRSFTGHVDGVNFVMFTPDGLEVLSGSWDKAVDAWYAADGRALNVIQGNPALTVNSNSEIGRLAAELFRSGTAFNPNTRMLASFNGLSGPVILWDGQTNNKLKEFHWAENRFSAIAFNSSGNVVAVGTQGGGIRLWDVSTGADVLTIKEGKDSDSIAMSPDGTVVAQASEGDFSIRLWSTNDESTLKRLAGHTDDVSYMVFSPDNKLLATSSDDETVRLWDVETGRVKILNTSTEVLGMGPLAFSPDGKTLVGIADNIGDDEDADLKIRFWDATTGELRRTLTPSQSAPDSIAFSPDGRQLAVGTRDKTILLLDAASGQVLGTLRGHKYEVVSMVFLNGETLQSWGYNDDEDEAIIEGKLWHTTDGTVLKNTLLKQSEAAADRDMHFFGSLPIIGVSQKFVAVPLGGHGINFFGKSAEPLNPFTQAPLASLYLFGEDDWLITTPEGFFDGSPGAMSHALWRFGNNTFDNGAVELYFKQFFYPNLLQEVLNGKSPKPPEGRKLEQIDRRQPKVEITAVDGQGRPAGGPQSEARLPTGKRTVTVTVEVSDNLESPRGERQETSSGARDLRLFRNGSLVHVWRDDLFSLGAKDNCEQLKPERQNEPRRVRCRLDIQVVAGDNQLTAYAFNGDDVKSDDSRFALRGAASLRRDRTLYVLTIGVGRYENPQFDLGYTAEDARDFGAEVRRQQERVGYYQKVEVLPLLDQGARKDFILSALKTLGEAVQPEDGVVVYFSGHGRAEGDRFYLVPSDVGFKGGKMDAAAWQTILAHSISDLELEAAFSGIDAGRLLLVIDACNSGKALQADDWRRGPMNTRGMGQFAYEKGMYVLTASQDMELAYESESLKHSYLTYALVEEGLKTNVVDADANGDGEVLLREWLDYAKQRVPRMRRERVEQAARRQNKSLVEVRPAEQAVEEGKVQHPKVFYRREPELQPFVVAKPGPPNAAVNR
ncbi:MAG TPA: PEGA domain-containing protein [Pyrinomonadaceae bacterium]|jgi:WD40 repeat protein|nr:PEGA domain-containing protein [Pyrinomonadaceae bacterium]